MFRKRTRPLPTPPRRRKQHSVHTGHDMVALNRALQGRSPAAPAGSLVAIPSPKQPPTNPPAPAVAAGSASAIVDI